MAEELEHAFQKIRENLNARLMGAVLSVRDITEDPEGEERRMKAALEEVEKAYQEAQEALDTLRRTLHP